MKNILISVILTGLMIIPSTAPITAIEHKFGGDWEMKAFTMKNLTGEDQSRDMDLSQADSTTSLVYTCVINENLKFVNKFELSAVWGDNNSFARIGTDGTDVSVMHSFADFSLGPMNFKTGVQEWDIARGFIFDDDFAGAVVTYKTESFELPFAWIKANEGWKENGDIGYFAVSPIFEINDMTTINPYFFYVNSSNAGETNFDTQENDSLDVYYIGFDLDSEYDSYSLWLTGIWQWGKISRNEGSNRNISSGLVGAGGSLDMGFADIHGQIFFASGQNDDNEDNDIKAFTGPEGCNYSWSEIMGEGEFDEDVSANSPGTEISNIMAANIGTTLEPMEKITVDLDLWYARLAEKADEKDYLGTEIDVKITYELLEDLNLEVIAAYMFAGDATYHGENSANPFEIGTKLSFEF